MADLRVRATTLVRSAKSHATPPLPTRHNARGYEGSAHSDTFSLMYFGNSIAAILAGPRSSAANQSASPVKELAILIAPLRPSQA